MENLLFSLNSTMPVFLLVVLGYFFHRIGWIDDLFASRLNTFTFRVALPFKVFLDLAVIDFAEAWNLKFVGFCFVVTLLSILIAVLIALLWKDRSILGEFVQATYRSSAAILGIAFITNIYGNSGMAPMMIIGSVPLYNVMAVLVLALMKPDGEGLSRDTIKKTFRGILTNPILIGIEAGLVWSALSLPMPSILQKLVSNVGSCATPMGLMAMGATFEFSKAFGRLKPALVASAMKLMGFGILFVPLAISMGFRNQELVAIIVMLGSATTVSSYVMARNMGHEGTLSASVVTITTLFAAVTLTFWLWLARSLGMI